MCFMCPASDSQKSPRYKIQTTNHNTEHGHGADGKINNNRIKWIEVRMAHSSGIRCDYYYFLFPVKHKQVLCEERQTATCQGKVYFFFFLPRETEEEEWLKENVTNRTEIINSGRLKKAATHARSYVRGLWPVSHIIEQSLRHSSSAIPVAVALFKNYKKKKKILFFLFCPFSPAVIFIFLLCPALCFLCSSFRSVLGHHLLLFLHHDALYVFGNQLF